MNTPNTRARSHNALGFRSLTVRSPQAPVIKPAQRTNVSLYDVTPFYRRIIWLFNGDYRMAHAMKSSRKKRLALMALAITSLASANAAMAQTGDVSVSGNITAQTCTIDTPSLLVDMGKVGVTAIKAVPVGSAVASFTSATITLTCEQGANVQVAFQDASNGGVIGGSYIHLTPGSGSASGVGIQLFRGTDDSAISLGVGYTVQTNTPAGSLSIPFRARYYRVATTVAPGAVNATGYFSITFL